ncbi:MAG: hypothetical protein HOE48_07720 [Candidatus Latescibacteria bacterium]|jgi:hypothetical protein|nr:hypothetical protein [Candidatus Latescibacterota bacterium]MBT4137786.1 hypothetical protein [Candidatus Latescibacterota bacterium]MBT5830665.1 hypothetical protein [Candidatus Latescibacterota bacterium]
MSKTQLVVVLIAICVVDMVIPVPILGLILVHVVFTRPAWFREMVDRVYNIYS